MPITSHSSTRKAILILLIFINVINIIFNIGYDQFMKVPLENTAN